RRRRPRRPAAGPGPPAPRPPRTPRPDHRAGRDRGRTRDGHAAPLRPLCRPHRRPHPTGKRNPRMISAAPEQTPRRLRAAVIGLGWGGKQHVAAYAADPTVDLVAITAMEEHLLEEFGEK